MTRTQSSIQSPKPTGRAREKQKAPGTLAGELKRKRVAVIMAIQDDPNDSWDEERKRGLCKEWGVTYGTMENYGTFAADRRRAMADPRMVIPKVVDLNMKACERAEKAGNASGVALTGRTAVDAVKAFADMVTMDEILACGREAAEGIADELAGGDPELWRHVRDVAQRWYMMAWTRGPRKASGGALGGGGRVEGATGGGEVVEAGGAAGGAEGP